MIPYFQFAQFSLGPFTIHIWGLMAAIGFLVATIVAARRARSAKLNPDLVWSASWQIVIASMIGSRIFEVLFYDPKYYWAHPTKIFAVWEGGMSVYGGIIAGALTLLWFIRRHKLPMLLTLDVFAYATPLGIMFGRIGCFLIHDHPGTLTHFALGVRFPGGTRHDGGLEMAIADGTIFLLFFFLGKKKLPQGLYTVGFLALKGAARFWLDFYRATDLVGSEARYAGLTPSQYAGILSMMTAVYFFSQRKRYA